jgi:hypothetical protein
LYSGAKKGNFEHFQKNFGLWAHSLYQINYIKLWKNSQRYRT